MDKPEQKKKEKRIRATPCETCLFYDVIDEDGTLGCTVSGVRPGWSHRAGGQCTAPRRRRSHRAVSSSSRRSNRAETCSDSKHIHLCEHLFRKDGDYVWTCGWEISSP